MKLIIKYIAVYLPASLAVVLIITTIFACTPSSGVPAATPTPVLDLPTERSADQIATLSTLTPQPTVIPAGEIYAWNNLAEMESAGISVQIARLVIADKLALPKDVPLDPVFQEVPVAAQIIFIVKNTANEFLLVEPHYADVSVASESLYLVDFPFFVGDIVNGGILPGETKIGGYWFAFRDTSMADMQLLLITIPAPVKFGDPLLEPQGPYYSFDLDLSQRRNDPVPDELKNLKSFQSVP